MYSKVLNTGENLIAKTQANRSRFSLSEFRVGEAADFDPSDDLTAPLPSTVWTGSSKYIATRVINNDTLHVALTIPESAGGFKVGNIVVYGNNANGERVAFGVGVSDTATPKYANTDTMLGAAIRLNMFFKYKNISEAVVLNIESPEYASLPSFANDLEMPEPEDAIHQQFFLQNYSVLGRPVLLGRRAVDNTYFGMPFLQRLDDPRFGWINGGFAGDGYKPNLGETLWGYYYVTPESAFKPPPNTGGTYLTQDIEFDDEPFIADPY